MWVLAPVLAWIAVELLVLPLNQFTFRAWEALSVMHQRESLPGPFYPDRALVMAEAGDLDPRGPRDRIAHWQTDRYGYRNVPEAAADTPYDVVLVGDSHIAGSRLSQEETLSVELARLTGWSVYNHAHRGVEDLVYLLRAPRFRKGGIAPDGVVVFELRASDLMHGVVRLPALPSRDILDHPPPAQAGGALEPWLVLTDRLQKANGLQWLRSRLHVRRPSTESGPRGLERHPLATPAVQQRHQTGQARTVELAASHAAEAVRSYRDAVREVLNRELLVVLLPGPRPRRPIDEAAAAWVEQVQDLGIPLLDLRGTSPTFAALDLALPNFFHPRDSHWTPEAVRKVAVLLAERIRELRHHSPMREEPAQDAL